MNPQLFPAVSEKLFAAGAKDVWFTPIQMKKGRPGVLFGALGAAEREAVLADIILRETTTLGVRVLEIRRRHEARREMRSVQTPYGAASIKVKWVGGEAVGAMPEYDDCQRLALAANVSVRLVHESATVAAQALLESIRDESPRHPTI
jgi:uncharacterized protein (DUF111 family)